MTQSCGAALGLAALLMSAMTATAGAQAARPSLQGLWVMNPQASQFPAAMKGSLPNGAPFEHSMHVHDDGVKLTITDVIKTAEDATTISTWPGAWDGKDHSANGHTMAFQRTGDLTYKDHWSMANGDTGRDECVFARDGMRVTCTGIYKPKDKQELRIVEVLDKVAPRLTVLGPDGRERASMQGLWLENFEESNFGARGTPFTYHALEVTLDDGKTLTFSDVITRTDGKSSKHTWSSAWEVPGKWPNGYEMTYQHLEPTVIRDHWQAPDGRIGGDTCTFSNNYRKMRCYGYNQPAGGKWTDLLEVSDRLE